LNILALETSTEACSVALMNSELEVFNEFEITPRLHTRYLPLMLNSVLARANLERNDISGIAYANGPGAFTGVRIAASTAQGLSIGLSVPLLGISTLAVLAQQACETLHCKKVLVALDARMGEAYSALYTTNDSHLVELSGEEHLIKLEQLQPIKNIAAAGSGFQAWSEAGHAISNNVPLYESIYPTATALVKLAKNLFDNHQGTTPDKAEINYIRNKVAEKKKTV
jgi:tRNA threonylcarbamoyladenosine biosynthesis protein TsaB